MNWLQALILGIIQGLTEFLPVSSSGHLVIFQKILGVLEHSLELDLAVHMGTLLSVLTYYRKDIALILKDLFKGATHKQVTPGVKLSFFVIAGSIPTALIGFTFKDQFKELFSNLTAVGIFLCVTGLLLLLTKKAKSEHLSLDKMDISLPTMTLKRALLIGLAQGAAIAPGISRAGSTIGVALLSGVSRSDAARFSFLLSIPVIAGAAILELKDIALLSHSSLHLWVGLFTAYLVGLFALSVVVKVVHSGKIHLFSVYLFIVGLLTIGLSL